jgi:DNA-directed RNA polymerase beta' subunit
MIGKFIRELYGVAYHMNVTRYNYACRAVIAQDPTLRIDQVKLPYTELVICLQQQIINILIRSYNISPSEAYDKWKNAIATYDDRVGEIINMIIKSQPNGGIPVIINRNPYNKIVGLLFG